jgi:DNA-binding MltR family transcriptional regulator
MKNEELQASGNAPWFKHLVEESDRGCVLIAHAILEEMLGDMLRAHFIRCSNASKAILDSLLSPGEFRPLGTFSPRIKVTCALGLIDPKTAAALTALNKIRISFAHYQEPRHTSITEKQLKSITAELTPSDCMVIERMRCAFVREGKESCLRNIAEESPSRFGFCFAVLLLACRLNNAAQSSSQESVSDTPKVVL